MKNNKILVGQCAICRKKCKLTFEHIPPRKAFNNEPIKMYTGDSYIKLLTDENRYPWQFDGLQYVNSQRGFGLWSLCKNCNNNTGSLYGDEYVKWVHSLINYILSIKDDYKIATGLNIKIFDVFPGRFIRQVLSFIASTDNTFIDSYPFVKKILLDANTVYSEVPEFHIYMYLLREPYIGITGKSVLVYSNYFNTINELNLFPFGFLITYDDKKKYNMVDITNFINCGYDDKAEYVELDLIILDKCNLIATDYRSKEEIKKAVKIVNNNENDNYH